MTDQTCTACQATVHDTVICPRCQRVTDAHLADMGAHLRELTTVMTKQTVYAERRDGGRSVDPTIAWGRMGNRRLDDLAVEIERNPIATPYAKAAAASLHDVRSTMVSWCRLLHDELGTPLPEDRVTAMATHLRRHLPTLANHAAAGELVAEVRNLVRRVMVVVDAPPNRARFPLPDGYRCPESQPNGAACDGSLVATFPADQNTSPTVQCQRCRAQWVSVQWTRVGDRILHRADKQRSHLHNAHALVKAITGKA